MGDISPDQVFNVAHRRVKPPYEGVDGSPAYGSTRPALVRSLLRVFGNEAVLDLIHEFAEGPDRRALDPHSAVTAGRVSGELSQTGCHRLHDDRVLLTLVLGVREEERQ
ncbi:MAG: hypothetical protein F4110_11820 [Acidimicrobiaceae bacterium]|nr:hypothetical protein [Acidimicrobiaceae bacterium]MXZ99160.1 hypothetical protein [Acidimicrobiaceae bacterium]MYE76947.1 hypothetical protein [Acidimicrobiaceae bacterium]MYE98306.1 hypothetical protein [Acidimicrobiaceae bacterium]MYH42300.1 hypothetical protein [Acidimicrobiaceae bacterium]